MVENFLTQKSKSEGFVPTLILVLMLLYGSFIYLHNSFNAEEWMPASAHTVYLEKQWWRAWTTLFAHGDMGHIISNLFLFIPFSYFLIGYFGSLFFPLTGFFLGGIINMLVIKTMPEHVSLIGVSGVVYWMGASWITLSFLIDTRERLSRRIIKSLGITAILFFPESLRPEVSYLTHFVGMVFGFFSALIFYMLFKKRLRAADKYQLIVEADEMEEKEDEEVNSLTDSNDLQP